MSLRRRGKNAADITSSVVTSADTKENATESKAVEESSQSGYYSDGTSSQVSVESAGSKPVTLLVDAPKASKWKSFSIRAGFSVIMILSFLAIVVFAQQLGCALLVLAIQAMSYSELVNIGKRQKAESQLPGFNLLYWWWFFVTSFLVYGSTLETQLMMSSLQEYLVFRLIANNDFFIMYAFSLYVIGLVVFVLSLTKKHYKYQFKQFALCHVVLILVVVQSSVLVSNMFMGLIWFLLPCSLVICNDIWAYIFGFIFGRTPLIKLSPKKTWEGYIGGGLSTFFFGFICCRIYASFALMTCPKMGFAPVYWPECEVDPMFQLAPMKDVISKRILKRLPEYMLEYDLMPMDIHTFWMALFASSIAPFGGFFASGFKRAFKIKDFGSLIPGHGGVVDRMDCQIMMGMFVYVYINSFVLTAAEADADEVNSPKERPHLTQGHSHPDPYPLGRPRIKTKQEGAFGCVHYYIEKHNPAVHYTNNSYLLS